MQNEHGVCDVTIRIALGSADCGVMHANFRKRFTICKLEISRNEVAFLGRHGAELRVLLRRCRSCATTHQHSNCEYPRGSCEHSADSPWDDYVIRSYTRARIKCSRSGADQAPSEKGL